MEREDSGVIDLFAVHDRARTAPPRESAVPADIFSSPMGFASDVHDENDLLRKPPEDNIDERGNATPRKPKKRSFAMYGAAGGALLLVGILVATFSGGSADKSRVAAIKVEAPAAAAAAPPPAPVVDPPPASAAIVVPPPPTTGASTSTKPPPRAVLARPASASKKPAAAAGGGIKMTKVQSGGVK